MARLTWDNDDSPKYQAGVSQGVFYGDDGIGIPWSGLISVTEKPQANAPTAVYNSLGEKYEQFGNKAEKKHGLACYTYPEEMEEYLGIQYLENFGFKADERSPKKFHMAYRVDLGNDLYEIHVLLNQIATFGETARNTVSNTPGLTTITMNLEGVPDFRIKTSHIILDSRLPLTQSAEKLLFGDINTQANIQEFLTAEPVWETVAINYAPIIEPDYDNMVWLGGENLVGYSRTPFSPLKEFNTSMFNYNFGDVYHIVRITPTSMPPAGSEIIATVSATLPPGRTTMRLYAQNDSVNDPVGTLSPIGGGLYQLKTTMREGEYQWLNLYGSAHSNEQQSNPGDVYVEWVKIERGTIPTPWTPAPSDNYVPDPNKSRPANYVPGVKGGRYMDERLFPARNSKAFYDENLKGLGHYSTRRNGEISNVTLRNKDIPKGLDMLFNMKSHVSKTVSNPYNTNSVLVVLPYATVSYPNDRGVYDVILRGSHNVASPNYRVQSSSNIADTTLVYKDILIAVGNYSGGFFDIYTTPPTKGDRYVRVNAKDGNSDTDYTIHQQLRLRSKSKVILSNITPDTYYVEASDSQLNINGDIFTFNGPQAEVVGENIFSINDTILGS